MVAVAVFIVGSVVSLGMSWVLLSRIERLGGRLRMPEALLGIVAALADAPEVTAAVSAMISHDQQVGAGVVLGSNVFNLAALLGLSAVVAGRIELHRNVVALGGIRQPSISGNTCRPASGTQGCDSAARASGTRSALACTLAWAPNSRNPRRGRPRDWQGGRVTIAGVASLTLM